jgi:hypothetical protein
MHGAGVTHPHVPLVRSPQGVEDLIRRRVPIQEIDAPAGQHFLRPSRPVEDLRGGPELLDEMPEIQQLVHLGAQDRLIEGRAEQRPQLRRSIAEAHKYQIRAMGLNRRRIRQQPVTQIQRIRRRHRSVP